MKMTRRHLRGIAREMIREIHAQAVNSGSIETPRWMQWPVTEEQVALHNRIAGELQREAQSSLHEPDSNIGVTALLLQDSIFEWFAELEKAGAPVEKYALWLVREISRATHGHSAVTQQSGWGRGPGRGLAESHIGKNKMKITRNHLRRIIKNSLLSEGPYGYEGGVRSLTHDEIAVLMAAGFDVAGVNPGNLTPDMQSALDHAAGSGDTADWLPAASTNLPDASASAQEVYWNDGEPVSKLIRMLQNMQTENGDIPVKGFKADGADIEGDGYITFTVHEPDEENEEFIDKVTLGIMSN